MNLKATVLLTLLGGVSSQTAGAAVDRVDPPNWWVGMADSSLQLMMYGNDIGSGSLVSKSGDVTISQVTRGDSRNYLFVDLTIDASADPQTVEFLYTAPDGATSEVSYLLQARRENSSDRQGFSARDAVYLIMPDRFANGDTSNDTVDHLHESADGQHPYGRHGGDLAGITKNLDYFTELGMTQLWMTPVLENNQKDSSYHGYAVTDLYRVDARLGSNADYVELSRGARKRGIGIIHDFVPNHIGSEHPWMYDLPTNDWINRDAEFSPTNHRRVKKY